MDPLRMLWAALAGVVAIAAGTGASAQHWPTRPITVVSPFVSGTTDDLVAQIVLGPVGQQIGQPFVLENRPGGYGTLGVAAVVKAAPDGQTLLLSTSAMSTDTILHKSLPYDAHYLRDLRKADSRCSGGEPSMLVAAPEKGYANLADLVAAAGKRQARRNQICLRRRRFRVLHRRRALSPGGTDWTSSMSPIRDRGRRSPISRPDASTSTSYLVGAGAAP